MGYLRSYIYFYTLLAVPLQSLKTTLLRETPFSSKQQRAYASKIKLGSPSPQELTFFLSIQEALSQLSTLVYHNPDKVFWIDLDASKEFGFGAIIFHTISNEAIPEERWPYATIIQPIYFLSKFLAPVERNY